MMLLYRSACHPTLSRPWLAIFLVVAVLSLVQGQQIVEDRKSYVPYPSNAQDILEEEVSEIGSPLGLEVVTSVANPDESNRIWQLLKGPAHRLHKQNQIIHTNPHFHVTDGIDFGCRHLRWDEDTDTEVEEEVLPVPSYCARHCTNHGRYCVVAEEDNPPSPANVRGKLLVEETLRRICFVELYHGSDLRFWEYMEWYDTYDCHNTADLTSCALRVLDEVPRTDYLAIDNCMHAAGGLEADTINVHLKEHMDKQTKGKIYATSEVPFFRLAEQKYTGIHDVSHIFQWICAVFEDKATVTPVACDFCSSCHDVQSCLWFLTCDGEPFDVATFLGTAAPVTQMPGVTAAPVTQIPATTVTPAIPEPSLPELPITSPPSTEEDITAPPSVMELTAEELATEPPTIVDLVIPRPIAETTETIEKTSPPSPQPTDATPAPTMVPTERPEIVSVAKTPAYDDNKNDEILPLMFKFGIPVLVALCAFGMYFLASWGKKRYEKYKKNEKNRSAQRYVNNLMDASYRDNFAIRPNLKDDLSDREFEDRGLDESYIFPDASDHNLTIRRRGDDDDSYSGDEDDRGSRGAPPPVTSFKVHQVLG